MNWPANNAALYAQYIAKQELTPDQLEANKMRFVEGVEDSELLKIEEYARPCVFIPYHQPDGSLSGSFRVRKLRLKPDEKNKYWQPVASGDSGPYLPQGRWDWLEVFADPTQSLIITEGEIKSIIAQDYITDIPILSIGGVSMQKMLMARGDIVWRDRVVVIAFDHDEGQEPGTYKFQVEGALGRLAEALILQGATVRCTQLGICARNQGMTGKVGLDDYLRAGGDIGLLLNNLTDPPKGCELLAEMFDRYVCVSLTKPTVWDSQTGNAYTYQNFRDATCDKWEDVRTGKTGAKVRKYKSKEFLEHPNKPKAVKFTFDPSKPNGYLPDEGLINSWVPFKTWEGVPVKAEYKAAFGRLVHTMAGEFPTQVAQWIAHYIRKPWERTSQCVLTATDHMGIGKSLEGEMVGHLVGEANYAETGIDRLADKFNAHLETKSWILINELDAKHTAKESWIKDLITREHNWIEHKGGGVYPVPNLRRYMMNSNLAASMKLGAGNRRVWVCRPSLNDDELEEWKEWLEREVLVPWHEDRDCWLASCREWLEEVDLEGYDPMADVINGEAAQELIDASMGPTESAAMALLEYWEASDDAVLVLSSHTMKTIKPVITILKSKLRGRGIINAAKLIHTGKGNRDWHTLFGRFEEGVGYELNAKGARIYIGPITAEEIRELSGRQLTWVVSATDHQR